MNDTQTLPPLPDRPALPTLDVLDVGLHGQKVLILGLGLSGLAMARWCVRQGARVTVADTRSAPPQQAQLQADCPNARLVCGPLDEALLAQDDWTLVARSPGLAPAQLAVVRTWAQAHGVPCVGELDLFAQALAVLAQRAPQPYHPQVLAITGTNGKTTVTSLTGKLLQHAGLAVAVAGNIGPALLDVLSQALDAEQASESASESASPLPSAWVLELSSFQLDGVAGGAWDGLPTAATVLNITEDHLDWHGSMDAYAQAKAAIFGQQALMLLNRDDPRVMAWQPADVSVKQSGRYRQQPARPWASFGLQAPQRVGDWGIETVNGLDWLVRAQPADDSAPHHSPHAPALRLQRLMPVDALRIRGRHNAANALAALALAESTGAPLAAMLHGLREYRGEPHRVEPVGVIDEVEYFDDSKGTNVGATLAAIKGLGAERRLVLILGGDGKGQDFSPLAPALQAHARAAVLIGRDAPLLRAALGRAMDSAALPLLDAASLPEAVALATQHAQPGDAVLMSPACASLDMFDNYAHRARVFVAAVAARAAERGMDLEALR
ncbi:MAG: UDP-N-acetylmuramoylalanine--D-glutamate ligase [Pseudomonadota bacterium]|jgi:UDP-N-acetylmuramoylalanine--D-glutamate ligase